MSVSDYSTTAASNDLVNYFKTGMRPSSVKNAGWAIMADIASYLRSLPNGAGTANAQTVANPVPLGAVGRGTMQCMIPNVANTGAATLNVDGLGAVAIFSQGAALVGGELQANIPAWLKHDGTRWSLLNPVRNTNGEYGAAAGTNTITVTIQGVAAYFDGLKIRVKILNTTTGAATLNVNGLGAGNIYPQNDNIQGVLPLGMLRATVIYEFIYNTSLAGWQVVAPSAFQGAFTFTFLTGYASPPSGSLVARMSPDCRIFSVSNQAAAAITGTSNATGATGSGIGSQFWPGQTREIPCIVRDNTATAIGSVAADSSGVWTFSKNGVQAGFTASGAKGLPANFHVLMCLS